MATREIYNYRPIGERLITGGQPTEEQVRDAAREGFTAVVNLATIDSEHALPDEAGLVRSLGMAYHHIPVDWDHPTIGDFDAFERLMAALVPEKVLLHCAANWRVSAFYSLYALRHLGWTDAQAAELRDSIWKGEAVPAWDDLIRGIRDAGGR